MVALCQIHQTGTIAYQVDQGGQAHEGQAAHIGCPTRLPKHDSFKLYHVISRSCPKHRTKRTHLKGDDGYFLTPTEETAAYVKFIADNWAGLPIEILELPPTGYCNYSLDEGSCTWLSSGTYVEILVSIHCSMAF